MRLGKALALAVPVLVTGAAAGAYFHFRNAMSEAEAAARDILSRSAAAPDGGRFDPAMLDGHPEIARRYFNHAIAPGTPLAGVAILEMKGTFLLGDRKDHQAYTMQARQVLRPPSEFVWMPQLRSGAMIIEGSDGLADGRAWTRFWLAKLMPVASVGSSPDVVRSASFRAATEGLWLPSSLLPQNGAKWKQMGTNTARVTITRVEPHIVLDLTLDGDGAVQTVVGQRWSNANPEKQFRLQPFGGTIDAEASFGGFTIPSRLSMGNHYGTADYLPFFQAEITSVEYR